MTRRQFRSKLRELMKENNKAIAEKMEKAIKEGGLCLSGAENNFVLPKMFMTVVCKYTSDQWCPLYIDKRIASEMNNIKHTI